jgi:hypothetical protein
MYCCNRKPETRSSHTRNRLRLMPRAQAHIHSGAHLANKVVLSKPPHDNHQDAYRAKRRDSLQPKCLERPDRRCGFHLLVVPTPLMRKQQPQGSRSTRKPTIWSWHILSWNLCLDIFASPGARVHSAQRPQWLRRKCVFSWRTAAGCLTSLPAWPSEARFLSSRPKSVITSGRHEHLTCLRSRLPQYLCAPIATLPTKGHQYPNIDQHRRQT